MLTLFARTGLLYNAVILVAVALNAEWVRTRAAGGGFTQFPTSIRVIYALQACLMLALAWYLTKTTRKWSLVWAGVFTVSTFMQLVSRSPDERWNAIPAIVIAAAFYVRARSERVVGVR